MGNRVIRNLEERQEDGRGALTRGAWLWVERRAGALAIETSALPRSAAERLAPLGFALDRSTGRCRALVIDGSTLALRRIGAAVLEILAEELES